MTESLMNEAVNEATEQPSAAGAGLAATVPESESLLAQPAACGPRRRRRRCRGRSRRPPSTPPPAHSGGAEYLSVKGTLHQQLLDELDRRNLLAASEETLDRIRADLRR